MKAPPANSSLPGVVSIKIRKESAPYYLMHGQQRQSHTRMRDFTDAESDRCIVRVTLSETGRRGAAFSKCERYRYLLWRQWSPERYSATFLMLNPSTADENANDPTVERCERRARAWGFGGLRVVNIFGLRSTDPGALYECDDPVGPDNDAAIELACENTSLIVCAWGAHGRHLGRGAAVVERLKSYGWPLHALRVNRDGTPAHPLYLPYSLEPTPFS